MVLADMDLFRELNPYSLNGQRQIDVARVIRRDEKILEQVAIARFARKNMDVE